MNRSTAGAARHAAAAAWRDRVQAVDWSAVRADLDRYGCALTGRLLTSPEAAEIAALYPDKERFRSTVNMRQHRFGEGEYRYFTEPFPVKHGVSVIRSGQRFTLGLVFHDAA